MTTDVPAGIVGVVRTGRPDHALTLARGWLMAGLPGVEITLTVPEAESVIAEIAADGGRRVGAGTVVDPARVDGCVRAGAAYLVAPDCRPGVIEQARRCGAPIVPGALTPTEMAVAVELGAAAVKVFPVSGVGGAAYVRSVLEPLPDLKIVASGGIRVEEIPSYMEAGAHAVCLGRELVPTGAVEAGDVDAVAEYAAAVLRRSALQAG